ncbi:hypothetical protein FRC08_004211 [Ceratobasidium sp. 394]|nr:hypothetical protein FRC08_004211 [Ceratobasidium sp. 394]
MASSSKRPTGSRSQSFARDGAKPTKYRTLDFTGPRNRFSSRPAVVTPSLSSKLESTSHVASVKARTTALEPVEAWSAPLDLGDDVQCDPVQSDSGEHCELDDDMEGVVLSAPGAQSGKVCTIKISNNMG